MGLRLKVMVEIRRLHLEPGSKLEVPTIQAVATPGS